MAKKASGSRAKTLTQETTVSQAAKYVAYGLSISKFTMKQVEERELLLKTIQDDTLQAMKEENVAYGNYQIPVGTAGNILEVPLSVSTDSLSPQDFKDLADVPTAEMEKLFEETEEITSVTNVSQLLKFIMASNNPATFLKVSKGVITLVNLEQAPGLAREKVRSPVKGFFVALDEALTALRGDDKATGALTTWVKARMKATFRVGNRPATP